MCSSVRPRSRGRLFDDQGLGGQLRQGAFAASVDDSLRKLRTDYIDLLLLHWPYPTVPLGEQIAGLNAAVKAGKVRHIGVSNFNRQLLAEAVQLSEAPIVANQVEYHPYLNQRLLIDECRLWASP